VLSGSSNVSLSDVGVDLITTTACSTINNRWPADFQRTDIYQRQMAEILKVNTKCESVASCGPVLI